MSRRLLALAAVLLLALPLLPAANADAPVAEPWSPYDTVAKTAALAFARNGPTIAAALDAYPVGNAGGCTLAVCPPTQAPSTTVPDLAIVQSDVGWVRNGTGNVGVNGNGQPLGRSLVAVGSDGRAVASVGLDYQAQGGGLPDPTDPSSIGGAPSSTALKLYVDRVTSGANFSTGTVASFNVFLPTSATTRAVGLAVSDDGSRAAVLLDDGTNLTLLAYNTVGGTQALSRTWRGAAAGLEADDAMGHLFVAGNLFSSTNNETHASVVGVDYGTNAILGTYSENANGTKVTSFAATPDGRVLALGTNAGRLVLVDGATMKQVSAYQAAGVTDAVTRIGISSDGAQLALAAAGRIATFRLAGATPTPSWSAPFAAHVNALSYNATGAILVASLDNGTDAGAYAFGLDQAAPFWKLDGQIFDAAVNDAGTEIAFRQSHIVVAQKLTRAFVLEYPNGGHTGPTRPLRAGATTVFDMVVRVPGSAPETVALSTSSDPSLVATIEPAVLTVRPGEPRHVNVTLASTPQFTGTHQVNLTAQGLSTLGVDSATLAVSFEGVANITFQVNQTEFVVTPGQPFEASLTVVNNGTSDAAVGLRYAQRVSSGAEWGLTLDQTSFRLPQGSITPIRVVVTPPANVANGTNDAVTFNLEGPNVSDQVTLNFRVNPHLGVNLHATGVVKYVSPSSVAFFNVTVTNNGSIQRAYRAFADQTPTNNRYWTVDLPLEPFRLEPGASRVVPVRVLAPGDITTSDHTIILVRVRSVPETANETFVEDNVTLFANYQAPVVTSTTPSSPNSVPFPAIPAILALAAVAALARRRREP